MYILHVAAIKNYSLNGVCVAVPAHIHSQEHNNKVALLNLCDCVIDNLSNQFIYRHRRWSKNVPNEFKYPDIVIFHEVYHLDFISIARQLQKEHIPYVIIPHGSLVKSALQKKKLKKTIANFILFNRFINKAQAIQCLSQNEIKNTSFSPVKILGTNGVAKPDYMKTNFNKSKVNITYIGRLEIHVKGIDLLIGAVSLISDKLRKNNVCINIYGPDFFNRYSTIESMIKERELQDIILLHHEISGKKKVQCLMDSDIFLQTSRHEGMPMGILEALSYGIPCLITKGTSLGEIVQQYDAGWVAETTIDSIKENLLLAINNRDFFEKKSSNAIQLVEDNFTWEVVSRQILEEYRKILNKNESIVNERSR